jgi:uncharacterized protein (TIGR04255 family)
VSAAKQFPEYGKPPVVEVACSIQFQPIEGLDTAHLGLLWSVYRDQYPITEQQAPLPNIKEAFGLPSATRVSVQFLETIPVPRAWFLNDNATRLVQVQQDRFVVNWRKLETGEVYPRFPELRGTLVDLFARFEAYLAREKLPPVVPDQVELTYVNHIPAGESGRPRTELQRILRLWTGAAERGVLPVPEDVGLHVRFLLNGPTGEPAGRLHVTLESRFFVRTGAPLYALTLIGRGAPEGEGLAGALTFLDRAHEWIVEGFTSITTPEMHRVWERQP